MVRPLIGSNKMPVGVAAVIITPRGPKSEKAMRMDILPTPGIPKPPSKPTKNTRSATGVVVFVAGIRSPSASNGSSPPSKVPLISPPNISPSIPTAMASIAVIGNSPSRSRPTSISMPSTAPLTFIGRPYKPLTDADRVSLKSSGCVAMLSQEMPRSVTWIGSQVGHWNAPALITSTLPVTAVISPAEAAKTTCTVVAGFGVWTVTSTAAPQRFTCMASRAVKSSPAIPVAPPRPSATCKAYFGCADDVSITNPNAVSVTSTPSSESVP